MNVTYFLRGGISQRDTERQSESKSNQKTTQGHWQSDQSVEQTNPVRGRRKAKIQVQPKKSHTYKEINNNTMREHEESHKLQCSHLMLEMQEIQNKLVTEECMAGRIGTGEGYWVIVNKFKEQHGWGGGVQSQRKEN